jgi:hypothetical protein
MRRSLSIMALLMWGNGAIAALSNSDYERRSGEGGGTH